MRIAYAPHWRQPHRKIRAVLCETLKRSRFRWGVTSLSSCSHFPVRLAWSWKSPVMLPPGLAQLRKSPALTGSVSRSRATIGVTEVAARAARTAWGLRRGAPRRAATRCLGQWDVFACLTRPRPHLGGQEGVDFGLCRLITQIHISMARSYCFVERSTIDNPSW
jgi:hypothetical protein